MSFEYPCIATNAVCTREKHRKTNNGNTHKWSKQRKIATQFIKCQIEKNHKKKKTKSFHIKVRNVNYMRVNKYTVCLPENRNEKARLYANFFRLHWSKRKVIRLPELLQKSFNLFFASHIFSYIDNTFFKTENIFRTIEISIQNLDIRILRT